MKFCPKCGSTIMPGINNCPNCGEVINNGNQGVVTNAVVSQQASVQTVATPTIATPTQAMPSVPQVAPIPSPVMPQPASEPVQNVPTVPQSVPVAVPPMAPVPPVVENKPVVEVQPTIVVAEPLKPVEPELVKVSEPKVEAKLELEKVQETGKEKIPLTPEEKEKKVNRIITITIIVVSVIALLVTAILLLKAFNKKESTNENTIAIATQYSYEGFEFFLPTGVLGSVEEGNFVIRDTENTWSAVITIQDGTYNSLVSNKSQISAYFETFGYVGGTVEEKEVSGTSFVTTEVLMGSKNVLVAYAKASGTKVYGILYTNELGTYDNYSLKVVGEVLASAINSGYDTAIPEGFTIDMFEETFEVAK